MQNSNYSTKTATLYYIYDPMCSWCYAFRPIWREVQQQLPRQLQVTTVLGGLAPDTEEPMPLAMQHKVRANWQQIIQTVPATIFNFDFWTQCQPRRSTYPACRAVLAAEAQQLNAGSKMLEAIQNAYYQQARNPSETSTLLALATELALDSARFACDLQSPEIQNQLEQNLDLADQLGVSSFPSLILHNQQGLNRIQHSYLDAKAILNQLG
ncbi:putative protein-disulfide isomerase [Thiothrix eikelboomii]|uniref:DSBA-like thioredoxin domain-containing protein n=1 Tax=Thiothrix eikelboomii TaxID=92487 RepID=A0A1T4XQB7_9GAMM|nr:DsbA family protein [Thiothrix eikelboomii]SKA91724.1 putative protein-disulfide isomerase [Thiothrix eikelboomii]